MSDQQKKYDYELEYAVNRDGKNEKLLLNEIPYDVYKAAKSYFVDHPDKALRLIINACGDEKGKVTALEHLDKFNTVAIQSMESGIAQLITPIPAELKKK